MSPKVSRVIPYEDYTVSVFFEDGKTVCYDVSPMLSKGVFRILKDKSVFLSRCTVLNGTLAWDLSGDGDVSKCIDIDPESLYSKAIKTG